MRNFTGGFAYSAGMHLPPVAAALLLATESSDEWFQREYTIGVIILLTLCVVTYIGVQRVRKNQLPGDGGATPAVRESAESDVAADGTEPTVILDTAEPTMVLDTPSATEPTASSSDQE
jgi:hypothetical protein